MRLIMQLLSSVRLGLVILALLALSCIAGSLIAANEEMGVDHGRAYVFHTPWFVGLMGLLLVNLCLATWERSYIALTLYRKKNTIAIPRFYEKAAHAFIVPWRGSSAALENLLRKRYTTVFRKGNAFYAQRGLVARAGFTIVHLGLLWTITSGFYRILADDFGWGIFDSTVILPEGESTTTFFSRKDRLKKPEADNLRERNMPFSLRCLDFKAAYHPHSTVARDFASLIELRDGDHTQIGEVTMQQPMIYKGYKITQNSFSPNDLVRRGMFQITDTQSGRTAKFDAVPGDPVKVPLPDAQHLFFQATALSPGAAFYMMDLAGRKVVQQGTLAVPPSPAARGAAPLPVDLAPLQKDLADSRYSFVVAALFPNFTFDEQKRPTTKDDKFENPAVLTMFFKNGQPNGYAWLFQNQEAQQIVGQPHPEVETFFGEYRLKEGSDGSQGLFDYEVEVRVVEKQSGKELGTFWTSPGKVTEIPGVDAGILSAPNVSTADPDHGSHTHDHGAHGHDHSTAPHHPPHGADGRPGQGGAAEPASASGGQTGGRYEVVYLGQTSGNVTYLGFMKDPSVIWLFAGCMIIVFGTLIAFIFTYREAWIWYDEENGLLYAATQVRGASPRVHRKFDRMFAEIEALGEPAEKEIPEPAAAI